MDADKKKSKFYHNKVNIDTILAAEKQHNKKDTWNKLDKTIKMQKLESFAYRYGLEQKYELKIKIVACSSYKNIESISNKYTVF